MINPSISIIIPLFNGEKFVIDALSSIANQDFQDWECLIINDGSQDNSLRLVEAFVASSSRPQKFRIFTTPNSGVSKARNLGLSKALSEFVTFLDCDDYWEINKLRTQIDFLRENPTYVGCVSSFFITKKNRSGEFVRKRLIVHRNINSLINGWKSLTGNGALISSSLLMRNLPELRFEENLSTTADLDFFLRLSKNRKIYLERSPLVNYRMHGNQMHVSAHNLLVDFKILLDEGNFFDSNESANAIMGNVYSMASILELSNKRYTSSRALLFRAIKISLLSPIRIIFAILNKRLMGTTELFLWRFRIKINQHGNTKY
jgi:glycosyltransferase involved in cell wall biosynthesis